MKKILNYTFAILAGASLLTSCAKEIVLSNDIDNGSNAPDAGKNAVTISASIADLQTKVAFEASYNEKQVPTLLSTTWESTDKLIVYNHADHSEYNEFSLVSGAGTQAAVFSGELPAGASYDVAIADNQTPAGEQTQPADSDLGNLKYLAVKENISDISTIIFDQFSSVLALTVKMPEGAAEGIASAKITASEDIFFNGKELTINIAEPGDEGSDGVLNLFAALPLGSTAIPAGTSLMVKLNAPGTAHTVYTRYMELPAGTFTANKVNTINVDATNSASFANPGTASIGTSANPYLIGDKYQLQAVNSLLDSSIRFFKLIDDIDMTGFSWTQLNSTSPYRAIDFDGNNKTISHLSGSLFYVFHGAARNLTLDYSNISTRGILAEFIQQSNNEVSYVTVSNGTVNAASSSNVGGMIGNINSKTDSGANNTTMTGCTVSNTSITSNGSNIGGLVGNIEKGEVGTSAVISNCTVSGTDVNCNASTSGGLIGFANESVTVSGCIFTGGTVSGKRYVGGLIGSTGNFASTITNCRVNDAAINATANNNDVRAGGFIGQIQASVQVKGCSVGTSEAPVSLTLSAPASGKVYNAGGFTGVNYGTITNNGDTRSSVYASISAGNTQGNAQLNIGGFVGYNTGSVNASDAAIAATSLQGSHIGGFAGYTPSGSLIENCTATGAISGTQKTGGFIGVAEKGSVTGCSASTTVSKVGTTSAQGEGVDFGGFVGMVTKSATLTKCSSVADISINTSYVGGFAGSVNPSENETANISRCYSTGVVTTSSTQCGAFIGRIAANAAGTVNVSDCYVTGNLIETNQRQGGLVGQVNSGIITISRCYTSGSVSGSFATGGLVGFMNTTATIEDCAAWNTAVTPGTYGVENWSSGAVIGVAYPSATLTNNYRNPDMALTAWWVPAADYNHPDVDSNHLLVVLDKNDGTTLRPTTDTFVGSAADNYPQFAYHGKVEAGKTLSQLAFTTLGWSSEIWDFSDDLPVLK
ncbi:MAG: hypothetical protein J6Y32_08740 [Bacteroidales bacterium]|nr:hypothetical protein [Bacteroidales bacterium]